MDTREFTDAYGVDIVYDVHPAEGTPRGVVQLLHGVGEHAGRYGALIAALTGAGFHVYADAVQQLHHAAGCPLGGMDVVDDVDTVGIGELTGIHHAASLPTTRRGCLPGQGVADREGDVAVGHLVAADPVGGRAHAHRRRTRGTRPR